MMRQRCACGLGGIEIASPIHRRAVDSSQPALTRAASYWSSAFAGLLRYVPWYPIPIPSEGGGLDVVESPAA